MANITSVKAIQILDSRGLPTVSCRVETDDGYQPSAKFQAELPPVKERLLN
tara:strand:- start:1899 stop:2051 length:153 start_codon:yes stop_codon:yes gene_type:complete